VLASVTGIPILKMAQGGGGQAAVRRAAILAAAPPTSLAERHGIPPPQLRREQQRQICAAMSNEKAEHLGDMWCEYGVNRLNIWSEAAA
jgi:hypothetical protein